jgi:hypothetical protein
MSCQDLAAVADVRSQYSGRPAGTPTQPAVKANQRPRFTQMAASLGICTNPMVASSLHFMFHGQPWRQNKSRSLCPIKHLLADRIAKNSTVCSSFNNFCKVPSCNYPIQSAANATLFSVFVQRPSLSLCELVEFTQF